MVIKHLSKVLFVGIFVVLCFQVRGDDLDELDNDEIEEFVPTHEWQRVKAGQAIPSGLHVRMDLSEGGRWAKLMDNGDSNAVAVAAVSESEPENGKERKLDKHSIDELKKALKNMKYSEKENDESQEITKFRNMEELKESLLEIQLNQETDIEVIQKLFKKLQDKSITDEEKLVALEDIEYYVHQIDNANDMVKIGGLSTLVDFLNSTNVDLVAEAAKVIGSASQSNPSVQIKVTETGILTQLLFLVANIQQTITVRKNSLFAVSAIIRNFPSAQQKFGIYGGINILKNVFQENKMDLLRVKVARLINDLVVERKASNEVVVDEEKRNQYNKYPMIKKLKEHGFCSLIPQLLKTHSHDSREASVIAMQNMLGFCKTDFHSAAITTVLSSLNNEYHNLANEEVNDGERNGYFTHLKTITNDLLSRISSIPMKEEL